MKPGIYYFKKDLRMVETAWLNEEKTIITVWASHCMKTGKGFMTSILVESFKKHFVYLGEV